MRESHLKSGPPSARRSDALASSDSSPTTRKMIQNCVGTDATMLNPGIILTTATVSVLVVELFFGYAANFFPAHGWLGRFGLVSAECLIFHGIEPAASYINPIAGAASIDCQRGDVCDLRPIESAR